MNAETLCLAALALVEASGDQIAPPENVLENRACSAQSPFALRYGTAAERAHVPQQHHPEEATRDGL